MKNRNVKHLLLIVFILLLATACISFNAAEDSKSQNTGSNISTPARRANEPAYRGDGGKGIVIAVPAPAMQNNTQADNWMPQLFQDLITGDLARFSAMTVIDRSNEQMVLAEQNLSASGNYSDNDYIRMGNLTNAQYIVAGNIQNIAGRYNVSFRINNTETNEIKTSFNKAYGINDIETGLAAKEAVRELLAGMGIELTDDGEKILLAIQPVVVRSTTNLARGMAEERNNNLVASLAYYIEAVNIAPEMTEASARINNFSGSFQTNNIRERAEFANQQKARWEKIFTDLRKYLDDNLAIVIHDFTKVEDTITTSGSRTNVRITISPGIKVVPDRTVLLVWKTVMDNWAEVLKNREENSAWLTQDLRLSASSLNQTLRGLAWRYYVNVGLYDEYGDLIGTSQVRLGPNYTYNPSFQVVAQHKYFTDLKFQEIQFQPIPVEKISNTITPKIIDAGVLSIDNPNFSNKLQLIIMPASEWQDWLSQRTATR